MSKLNKKIKQKNVGWNQVVKLFVLGILFYGFPQMANGQMFSVDDSRDASDTPSIAIFAGLEPMDFDYQGNEGAFAGGAYDFSGNLLRFRLESSGTNIYLGFGGNTTGLDEAAYFDAGIRYGYGLAVYQTQNFSFQLPFVLHASFTSVSNDNVVVLDAPNFRQGTLEIGSGLDISARLGPQFRIGLRAIPSYGFSFSTREEDASGGIAAVKGEGRLFFDRLFGDAGLSLGYDYNLRWFNIEGEALDYKASAHSILIGITF